MLTSDRGSLDWGSHDRYLGFGVQIEGCNYSRVCDDRGCLVLWHVEGADIKVIEGWE